MFARCLFTTVVVIANLVKASAQPYMRAAEEEWLPHQTSRCVFQDSKQNIWVGTNSGLYRYNLHELINYNLTKRTSSRLLNNTIHAVIEDGLGRIWVGTESGVGILTPGSDSVINLSKADETATDIQYDGMGSVFVLFSNNQLKRFPLLADAEKIGALGETVFDARHASLPISFSVLPDGKVVIGGDEGIILLHQDKKARQLLGNIRASSVLAGPDHYIYWSDLNTKGVYRAKFSHQALGSVEELKHNDKRLNQFVQKLKHYKERGILVITQQLAYHSLLNNPTSLSLITKANEFPESSLTDGIADATNNIWLSSRKGLYKLRNRFLHLRYNSIAFEGSDSDVSINQMVQVYPGTWWLLTSGQGIASFDENLGAVYRVKLPFKNCRYALPIDDSILLIADGAVAMVALNKRNSAGELSYRHVFTDAALMQATSAVHVSASEYWIGVWKGGAIAVNLNGSPVSQSFREFKKAFHAETHVFDMLKDRNNKIWLGTRGEGILCYNPAAGSVKRFGRKQGLSDRIVCLALDSYGKIWAGTRGEGLLLYNPEADSWKLFDEKDGLPSNTICAIQPNSRGEIWVSTHNGVAVHTPEQFLSFHSFGKEDGITTPEFTFKTSGASDDGSVYFGNGSGFFALSKPSRTVPLMAARFNNFSILKTRSDSGASALLQIPLDSSESFPTLKHNQNSIRISFSVPDYTNPQRTVYAHRLLGRDSAWTLSRGITPGVEFLDLQPGDYTFEVMASNSLGEWPVHPSRLHFQVAPWIFNTPLAWSLYLVLALALATTGFLLYRRWKKLNSELATEQQLGKTHQLQMVHYTDLSHEIKNRLTLLLGPLEQALTGKKVNAQILTRMYEQAVRLKKLSDQIMDIRRSQEGEFLLNVAEENISRHLENLVREANPLAMVRNIRLTLNAKRDTVRGWCDEELLEIIVLNLLNNAIKFTRNNSAVTLSLDSQYLGANDLPPGALKEGNYALISVVDAGMGIPKSDIERITEPFYRAANTRLSRKQTPGTGVGLNLVARLVKKHHGVLDIQSEAGEFTAVNVWLPIDKNAYQISELRPDIGHAPIVLDHQAEVHHSPEQLIRPATSEKTNPASAQKAGDYTVLVVDDNPELLNMVSEALNSFALVETAGNGEEGLRFLKTSSVNLVISDLDMPQMNGLTLFREMRALKQHAHTPFLIITGRNSDEQKRICFEYDINDFIEKPFSVELLQWKVKGYLRSQPAKLKTVVVVEPGVTIAESEEERFIQTIVTLIEEHIDKDYLTVDFLAEKLFTSRATFYRRMELLVGEAPSTFIRKYRLKKAASILKTGQFTVGEIARKTGFANAQYFGKCFQKEYGVAPSHFAKTDVDF